MFLTLWSSEIHFSEVLNSREVTVTQLWILIYYLNGVKQLEWFLHYLLRLYSSFLPGSTIKTPFHEHSTKPGLQYKADLPRTHEGAGAGWPRQPESLESSPVVGQCTGLLGEVLATGTTRGNCYKLSPCLKNLNTPHLNLWCSLGLSEKIAPVSLSPL